MGGCSVNSVGIIPAGGRAQRFNGVLKELLPVGEESLMRRTVGVLRGGAATSIIVLSAPDKVAAHMRGLEGLHGIYFVQSDEVLFKSILRACEIPASWYLFAMPDTFLPEDAFYRKLDDDFVLGIFKTDRPEKFGVCIGTGINDKDESLKGTTQWAWGVAAWSHRIRDFWLARAGTIQNHTEAFNLAMTRFGWRSFHLAYYHDVASWLDYETLVKDVLPLHR